MSMGLHYVSELRRLTGLLFIPRWHMSVEGHSGIILTWQNWRTRRKICPSATLPTANPTWTDLGLHCERPVTNCLSHGMAIVVYTLQVTIQQFWGMLSIDSVSSWQYQYWHPHPASLIFHKMQVCAKLKVVSYNNLPMILLPFSTEYWHFKQHSFERYLTFLSMFSHITLQRTGWSASGSWHLYSPTNQWEKD
jgi:hypothetical protein